MIVRPTRRDVLRYGSAAALAALPAPAIAQAWPSKPIKIIVTYPAGGLTDVFAPMASMSATSSASPWWSRTRRALPARSAQRW